MWRAPTQHLPPLGHSAEVAPVALLARQDEEGLRYAGGAFFALKAAHREALRERLDRLSTDRSPIELCLNLGDDGLREAAYRGG
jgi:hypothetical protein